MAITVVEEEDLSWVQTSPRTYERPLDDMENFFALAGEGGVGATDGQHWHIAIMAKIDIEGIDLKRDLPVAWMSLRQINPCLSAVVEGDRLVYTIADYEELGSWLNESLHFHDKSASSRDVFPIRNRTGRAALHVLLPTQELYLLAPHTHLDGIGAYTAMNNLVQALADAANASRGPALQGDECRNLVGPLNTLASIPVATDTDRATFRTMLGKWMAGFAGVKLRLKDTKQPCREPRTIYRPFTVSDSKLVIAKCKEAGFTVTAGVQAAVSMALRKQVGETATFQSAVTIHDVRKWVDKTQDPATTLVGPMAIPVPAVFTVTDDFLETARLASQKYREPEQSGLLRVLPRFWGNDMVGIIKNPPPGSEAPSSLGVSSFGIMDNYLRPSYQGAAGGKVEVKDAWLGITLYSPDILLHLWTFQGSMRLQCVYNEAYHDKEAISELLKSTEDELLRGLGLNAMTT
ncbi:uncharacterized protein K489DRAFT_377715 [Dissoconium aciculare CBS 342.82]|uniref:CoA-dependent acyltransferase n=1 Tax=Dissoconium aciculare CBS 342.82 TaxID=1314786 RepID=A0A6J3MBD1_9PEZI|nr:uncharacterized protein K489DRAFT_377715 [Dissoconium aciculare CBS 342.82]KAF1825168.1 hypothetical protein K489DRAFT_377715 [Dissoconium aciculare CBS 342.82]